MQWFADRAGFTSPCTTTGTTTTRSPGDMSRNSVIGPSFVNTDVSLIKNTKITERVNLQFRADAFDVFNHPNFGNPKPYRWLLDIWIDYQHAISERRFRIRSPTSIGTQIGVLSGIDVYWAVFPSTTPIPTQDATSSKPRWLQEALQRKGGR